MEVGSDHNDKRPADADLSMGDTGLEPVFPSRSRTISTTPPEAPQNHAVEPFPADFERSAVVPDAAVIDDWELITEAVSVARAQDTNPRTIAKYELHLGHFADYLASMHQRLSGDHRALGLRSG